MNVELISYWGSDITISNCARVSYNKEASNYTEEQNEKLIKYLIEHKHLSPFRHSSLQFRITCPIYVERQIFKHSVGISVNSISGRYVDFSDSYTTITEWRKQSKSSKQGSEGVIEEQDIASMIEQEVIENCKLAYISLLDLGVSKEQARSVLPLSLNTTFIWTGTFLAFIHMCELRLKKDAQQETRELVKEMYNTIINIDGNPFKYSMKHFDVLKENQIN